MLYFQVPVACSHTPLDLGRSVCILSPRPGPEHFLNEVSYVDMLTRADCAEALTFTALAAIALYCGVRVCARGLMLRRVRRDSVALLGGVAEALYLNDRGRAFRLLSSSWDNPLARVVCAGLEARAGDQIECFDGGVSWGRNLAMYTETLECRKGLGELNAAACLAPVVAMLFGWYLNGRSAPGPIASIADLGPALAAGAFSLCIAAAASSMYLWQSSAASELCQSLDRLSAAIVGRLVNPEGGSTALRPGDSSHGGTMPLPLRRTRQLAERSPFTLLNLRD